MASPVDTSVKYFTSDMPGAPVLTGQAGSLIALLDACLVNGWGVQTASSVVVAGGVATATFPSNHAGFPDAVVLVAGATPAGLNGEQKITARGANTIQWATASPDGAATGTITVKMAPAGFNKPFSGTNLAVYKSTNVAAHGQFLRVADTATRAARVVGYETMSAVSTGTGPFPTGAQISGGYYWNKAESTDATPVPWAVISDGRTVHYMNAPTLAAYGPLYYIGIPVVFGDMIPRTPAGDVYATILAGQTTNSVLYEGHVVFTWAGTDSTVAAPRSAAATAGASRGSSSPRDEVRGAAYLPNPISGQVEFSPVHYRDPALGLVRASIPGVALSTSSYAENLQQTTWRRTKTSGGKTHLFVVSSRYGAIYNTDNHFLAYDITGPWR